MIKTVKTPVKKNHLDPINENTYHLLTLFSFLVYEFERVRRLTSCQSSEVLFFKKFGNSSSISSSFSIKEIKIKPRD